MKNEAFIDGQNLHLGTKQAEEPWEIDLKKLRVYLKEKYNVHKAYYHIGYFDESRGQLYQIIRESGYLLVFRAHNLKTVSSKKGNVDTDIVFSVMKKLCDKERFDKVVLLSGDGDYFKMASYLISKNKFLTILGPAEKKMSSLYKRNFNPKYYNFLDRKEIKQKIKA